MNIKKLKKYFSIYFKNLNSQFITKENNNKA